MVDTNGNREDEVVGLSRQESSHLQLGHRYAFTADSLVNLASGTPDVTNPATIQAMYPAFDTAKQFGAILGLHEYSAPYLNSTYSGGRRSLKASFIYLTLRLLFWRRLVNWKVPQVV